MAQQTRILGWILLIATLALVPACDLNTTPIGDGKKDSNNETAASSPTPNAAPKIYPIPPEILNAEMKTLGGKTIKLADYKGKVVLVNQWATWCGPCRMEIPELIKISQEMKDQGVEIIGMTIEDDRGNDQTAVKSFVKREQMPYQVVWATDDVWMEFASYGRASIPQSFILDRDGNLTAIFAGFNPGRTPQGVRKALTDALN